MQPLDGFDRGTLQCSESRVVADGGVYACPILAGLPGAPVRIAGVETGSVKSIAFVGDRVEVLRAAIACPGTRQPLQLLDLAITA